MARLTFEPGLKREIIRRSRIRDDKLDKAHGDEKMKLRMKTVIFTGIVLLVMFTVLLVIANTFLLQNYQELEEQKAYSNVQRVLAVLKNDLDELAEQATDYSASDDTVAYLQSAAYSARNTYIVHNYPAATFTQNHLDFIIILNKQGEVAFSSAYDDGSGELIPLSQGMLQDLTSYQERTQALRSPLDSVKGITLVDGVPSLVAYRPIVDSHLKGPFAGTMIFGRYLDQSKVREISAMTRFDLEISPISEQKEILSKIKQTNLDSMNNFNSTPIHIAQVDEQMLYGQVLLEDLGEEPLLLLTVKMDRIVYQQGKSTILSFLFTMLLLGILCAAVGWYLVDRTVTRRLLFLKEQMDYVQHTQDLLAHVPITGKDEISSLENGFNDMIGELKSAQSRMRELALHDPLTQLPNRLMFREFLDGTIEQARQSGEKVAVIFIDLDRFKYINDTLGHDCGDELLVQVSQRLQTLTEDVPFFVSRLGGDEFTIIIPHLKEEGETLLFLHKLREKLGDPYQLANHQVTVTASIGASLYPHDGKDAFELVKHADIAMYQAKDAGKNNVQLFEAEMKRHYERKMELENELRNAIENKEFALLYQPKILVESGKIAGMEALVRWNHPEKGWINPAEFIPLAEETGLIIPLGKWVMLEACSQNKQWLDQGFPPLVVSVNVSAVQFAQSHLVQTVKEVLQETGLDASLLELEITETVIMTEIEKISRIMEELRALGVKISVDDFGTGFSSLNYLKKLPLNTLKIAKEFIDDIQDEDDHRVIESAVVSLAQGLNLEVLAEGVETEIQLKALKKIGCHYIQGYLFSKPLPPAEFAQLLIEHEMKSNRI